jgi:hypothetical protein
MSAAFGCNPEAAAQLSQTLSQIRADLSAAGERDAWNGSTGSSRVDGALTDFLVDSSDSRAAMGSLLDRAAGLMRGLSEGTLAVDRSLAGSLDTAVPLEAGSR